MVFGSNIAISSGAKKMGKRSDRSHKTKRLMILELKG